MAHPAPHTAVPAAAQKPAMTYRLFLEERRLKEALGDQQAQFIDQWLLTLSGGALGLSLTFMHDHPAAARAVWCAYVGMIALVGCLALVLSSLVASQRSINSHISALDEWCGGGFMPGHRSQKVLHRNWWAGATGCLNWISMALCIAGIVALALFVGLNLK